LHGVISIFSIKYASGAMPSGTISYYIDSSLFFITTLGQAALRSGTTAAWLEK
jgi:hypothetical protein